MAHPDSFRQHRLNASSVSLFLSIVIIFICFAYYMAMLGEGPLQGWDEYRTLDRSNGFSISNDWLTVYSENEPTFKKPPLQYWLTATLLNSISNDTLAARLPSFGFGLLLAISTGVLAYRLNQDNPYAAPSAIFILFSSSLFWQLTISAMLDTGMVFFVVLAVIGTLLALREPRYWYLVAFAIGAGALQKTPIALLIVGTILALIPITKRYHGISLAAVVSSNHFIFASLIMVVTVIFWPALQFGQYGSKALRQAYLSQMIERFDPLGKTGKHKDWMAVFYRREAIVWIPAMISVTFLPFVFRRFPAFVFTAVVFGFLLVMSMASGNVYDRYALLILPFLAASLAALSAQFLPGIVPLLLATWLCWIGGGPFKSAHELGLTGNGQDQYKPLFESVSSSLSPDEKLVTCDWSTDTSRYPPIWTAALSYYGSKGQRIYSTERTLYLDKSRACGQDQAALSRDMLVSAV